MKKFRFSCGLDLPSKKGGLSIAFDVKAVDVQSAVSLANAFLQEYAVNAKSANKSIDDVWFYVVNMKVTDQDIVNIDDCE